MKSNVTALRASVEAYENLRAQRHDLVNQQSELGRSIEQAKAAGSPNDSQFVQRYALDKARLDLFPSEIGKLDAALAPAIETVKARLLEVAEDLTRATGIERKKAGEDLESFLGSLISDDKHQVQRLVEEALPHVTAIRAADTLAAQFPVAAISMESFPDRLLTKARYAMRTAGVK
jgi:hypothetical protein